MGTVHGHLLLSSSSSNVQLTIHTASNCTTIPAAQMRYPGHCHRCDDPESYDDNDIILCDGPCNRAYHERCLHPPLVAADLPEDEGWLCPACDVKVSSLAAWLVPDTLRAACVVSNLAARHAAVSLDAGVLQLLPEHLISTPLAPLLPSHIMQHCALPIHLFCSEHATHCCPIRLTSSTS
jgi:hypothetical protein